MAVTHYRFLFDSTTLVFLLIFGASLALAHPLDLTPQPLSEPNTQEVFVTGRSESLLGEASTAAEGRVGQSELSQRPILRPAEILESVPGLIISQHSGSGKANQYYLRGFNLDHGTDFLSSLDGMPVNLPTHAHGQGYTDLNFLIPELVDSISYRKGPYYADKGDFASAGSADIHLFDVLPASILSFTGGKNDYGRALAAGSTHVSDGHLLYALETQYYNGPWQNEENLGKFNGVLRYSEGDDRNGFSLTALGYHSEWDSTDQIPRRAVDDGSLSRLGTIDPTDGGRTSRYSLVANWRQETGTSATRATMYGYYYDLNLYSNFTYFLDDPINGDQFEQADRRIGTGGEVSHQWAEKIFGKDVNNSVGFQIRNDDIPQVALFHTKAKTRLSTTRDDSVLQTSTALYAQSELQWLEKFRTTVGLRGDLYRFDVNSNRRENGGVVTDHILTPKLGATLGPWSKTELYLNGGSGFHSNDARGTTISVDPSNPSTKVDQVDPLVRSKGMEVGVRTATLPGLVSTVSLWRLDLDSELLFVGDAGSTEASRPSRRTGVEFANYYKASRIVSLDADLSFSRAHFKDEDPTGERIPGSINSVIATGIAIDSGEGLFYDMRLRYFGPRSLIEDNSVRSNATKVVNSRVGYHIDPIGIFKKITLSLDALNIFNSHDSDIDYYYTSRLPGEPTQGVQDKHFHPVEPATYRLTLAFKY